MTICRKVEHTYGTPQKSSQWTKPQYQGIFLTGFPFSGGLHSKGQFFYTKRQERVDSFLQSPCMAYWGFRIEICRVSKIKSLADIDLFYIQLDWTSNMNRQKNNSWKKNIRATAIPRPPLESSRQEESRSAWSIFVKFIFDLFFQNNFPNNAQTKVDHADLDLLRQILICRGLRPFWGASVCTRIDF